MLIALISVRVCLADPALDRVPGLHGNDRDKEVDEGAGIEDVVRPPRILGPCRKNEVTTFLTVDDRASLHLMWN
ncbi:hypothetical protein [Streptomyces sp. NPDC056512]|uniref:hypothetical protein n=1 Tax=Streptomyces sp. NPDC056512 TaxID=3345846 RepID=UPI00369EC040